MNGIPSELIYTEGYFTLIVSSVILAFGVRWWLTDNSDPHSRAGTRAVLITGCDSGLGLQTALLLDNLGYVVFAGCLNASGKGAGILRNTASNRLVIVELDVTDDGKVAGAKDVVEMVLLSLRQIGLWAIINNAGVYVVGEFEWLTLEQCQHQVDVNLMGVIRVTKAFLPLIKKAKGRIINISSFSGRIGVPYRSVYCATKFGLEGLSDSLRNELHKYGVQVAVIGPGNHSQLTDICANREKHAKLMLDNIPSENRIERHRVKLWSQSFNEESDKRGPSSYLDTTFLSDVIHAVSSDTVKRYYVNGSWWDVKTFHVCRYLPSVILDWILQKYNLHYD